MQQDFSPLCNRWPDARRHFCRLCSSMWPRTCSVRAVIAVVSHARRLVETHVHRCELPCGVCRLLCDLRRKHEWSTSTGMTIGVTTLRNRQRPARANIPPGDRRKQVEENNHLVRGSDGKGPPVSYRMPHDMTECRSFRRYVMRYCLLHEFPFYKHDCGLIKSNRTTAISVKICSQRLFLVYSTTVTRTKGSCLENTVFFCRVTCVDSRPFLCGGAFVSLVLYHADANGARDLTREVEPHVSPSLLSQMPALTNSEARCAVIGDASETHAPTKPPLPLHQTLYLTAQENMRELCLHRHTKPRLAPLVSVTHPTSVHHTHPRSSYFRVVKHTLMSS